MFFTQEWRDRIISIRNSVRELKQSALAHQAVPEFNTGILIAKQYAESRELRHKDISGGSGQGYVAPDLHRAVSRALAGFGAAVEIRQELPKQWAYFRKGGAPDCDYILCDGKEITYWKKGKTAKDSQVKAK